MSWELSEVIVSAAAGRYATQADIESAVGAENVRVWSNLENTDELADAGRVTDALQYADALIDAMLAEGPYRVPLQLGAGEVLVRHWAARLAAVWLWRGRAPAQNDDAHSGMREMQQAVLDEIAQVRRGAKRIDAAHSQSPQTNCPAVIKGE